MSLQDIEYALPMKCTQKISIAIIMMRVLLCKKCTVNCRFITCLTTQTHTGKSKSREKQRSEA